MSARLTSFSLVEHLSHMEQERSDAIAWHEALDHFKTDREREAFAAGFMAGAGKARANLTLHAGLRLSEGGDR